MLSDITVLFDGKHQNGNLYGICITNNDTIFCRTNQIIYKYDGTILIRYLFMDRHYHQSYRMYIDSKMHINDQESLTVYQSGKALIASTKYPLKCDEYLESSSDGQYVNYFINNSFEILEIINPKKQYYCEQIKCSTVHSTTMSNIYSHPMFDFNPKTGNLFYHFKCENSIFKFDSKIKDKILIKQFPIGNIITGIEVDFNEENLYIICYLQVYCIELPSRKCKIFDLEQVPSRENFVDRCKNYSVGSIVLKKDILIFSIDKILYKAYVESLSTRRLKDNIVSLLLNKVNRNIIVFIIGDRYFSLDSELLSVRCPNFKSLLL